MAVDFSERMSRLANSQLLDVMANRGEYVPEAVTAAQAEIERRGGAQALGMSSGVETQPVRSGTEPGTNRKRMGPILTAACLFAVISAIVGKFVVVEDARRENALRISSALAEMADQENADAPRMIDQVTRFEGVASSASGLSYRFTLLGDIPVPRRSALGEELKANVTTALNGTPELRKLMDKGIVFEYSYYTESRALICHFTVGRPDR